MQIKSLEFKIYLANILLALLIFYIDLLIPAGIATTVPYIITILISISLPTNSYIFFFTVLCSILTVMGHYLSPPDLSQLGSFIDRSITIATMWITAAIAIYRQNITALLQNSENMKKLVFSSSIHPVITLDHNFRIQAASESTFSCFGWEDKELIGKDIFILFSKDNVEKYKTIFTELANNDAKKAKSHLSEAPCVTKDNKVLDCEVVIHKILAHDNREEHIIYTVTLRDLSAQKERENKLSHLANHDGLTGLYNRRYFNEKIQEEWNLLMRINSPLSFIIIDIDFFKKYNDSLGHQAGDACLQSVSKVLKHVIKRTSDFPARYGGEEFVVLLPNTNSVGAQKIAEDIKQELLTLAMPHPGSEQYKIVTASMGINTAIPSNDSSIKEFIENADKALYHAKENGRNNYQIYSANIANNIKQAAN